MSEAKNDGGPAFPVAYGNGGRIEGMTLRDYFASNSPTDEVQEIMFRHLSKNAQEAITGMKRPVDEGTSVHAERIAFQLADFEFKCAVNAAIRFKLADAMLRARGAA